MVSVVSGNSGIVGEWVLVQGVAVVFDFGACVIVGAQVSIDEGVGVSSITSTCIRIFLRFQRGLLHI
jgi:hypothetical protein